MAGARVAPGAAPAAAAAAAPKASQAPVAAEDVATQRSLILSLLEEKKLLGEPVTIGLDTKEIEFTGLVIRIVPHEGFAVLENVDGRRRGLWYILGGTLKTRDGQVLKLPMDGLAR